MILWAVYDTSNILIFHIQPAGNDDLTK